MRGNCMQGWGYFVYSVTKIQMWGQVLRFWCRYGQQCLSKLSLPSCDLHSFKEMPVFVHERDFFTVPANFHRLLGFQYLNQLGFREVLPHQHLCLQRHRNSTSPPWEPSSLNYMQFEHPENTSSYSPHNWVPESNIQSQEQMQTQKF